MGFLPWEICVAFPGESQLWQSCATQQTVHAGCFSVSVIHWTLTQSAGSLTCQQMLVNVIAHRNVRTHVQDFALKVESVRKFLATLGNQTCVNSMVVQCFTNELHLHSKLSTHPKCNQSYKGTTHSTPSESYAENHIAYPKLYTDKV